jgi:acetyl-CoA carboxylase carboxyl transferase subunit beta
MNWITSWKKIGIKVKKIFKIQEKIDPSSSLWENCPSCSKLNYKESLRKSDFICTSCQYYFDRPPLVIVNSFFPLEKTFIEPPTNLGNDDPLNFKTELGKYADKLAKARKKEKQWCSIVAYKGLVENLKVHLITSNFKFLGGSWGLNESFYFQKAVDDAIKDEADAFIMILKTGGVSMFNGTSGLNAVMAGGVIGMQKLKEKNILTFAVGQSKTTGGVLASLFYSSEIVIFEKGAHDVTFAGKKISKNYLTAGEAMVDTFGSAEEKLAGGFADLVVERSNLKSTICTLAKILKKKENITLDEKESNVSTDEVPETLSGIAKRI